MSKNSVKQTQLPIFNDPTDREPEPEGIDAMLRSLRTAGAPLEIALKSGGFSMDDYELWQDDESRQELVKEIRKAEADFCVRVLKQVVNSADMGNEKSAQWLLERRFTNLFGKTSKTSVTTSESRETEIVVEDIGSNLLSEITEEEFRLMAVEVLQRKIKQESSTGDDE